MRKSKLALLAILIFSLILFLSGCGPTNQPPNASFSANPTSGNASLEVTFDASNSSDPDGSIISYVWDFDNGLTGSGETATHTYDSAGNYTAELTVTDNDGATDSTTQSIDVSPPPSNSPTASFTASPTSGEAPLDVSFDASGSNDPDGTIDSYSWDFDDGSIGSGVNVNHTFDSSGTYNVELTVTDNGGASDSTSKIISVSSSNDQKLEIVNWQLEKDALDYARIVGEAKNVSGEEIDSATIGAKFFDANNTRLSVNYTPISDLASGVTTDFEIMTATEYSKVDHVDVYVDDVFIW